MSQCFSSINHQKCTTFHKLGLLQVHRLTHIDLLKRNIVTCVIRPKINIVQIDLACRRNFTVIYIDLETGSIQYIYITYIILIDSEQTWIDWRSIDMIGRDLEG